MPASTTAARQFKFHLATAIKERLHETKMTTASLARTLGTNRTAVRRLLSPSNIGITLQTMTKAADAVGLDLTIRIRRKSPAELVALTKQAINNTDPVEAQRLEDAFIEGFYGKPTAQRHAKNPTRQPA